MYLQTDHFLTNFPFPSGPPMGVQTNEETHLQVCCQQNHYTCYQWAGNIIILHHCASDCFPMDTKHHRIICSHVSSSIGSSCSTPDKSTPTLVDLPALVVTVPPQATFRQSYHLLECPIQLTASSTAPPPIVLSSAMQLSICAPRCRSLAPRTTGLCACTSAPSWFFGSAAAVHQKCLPHTLSIAQL